MRPRTLASVLLLPALLPVLSGCAPATFISTSPPPDVTAEAWYSSAEPEVRDALRRAMVENGLTPERGSGPALVGNRRQVPYVGEGATGVAGGPLPSYRIEMTVVRNDLTHVRATASAVCSSCDGSRPYEWEYPGELIRGIFASAQSTLKERSPRYEFPRRTRPQDWDARPRNAGD